MLPSLTRPRLPETITSESHVSRPPRSRGRSDRVIARSSPERTPYASKKSPSTLRRQLGVADRELAEAIAARDQLQTQLSVDGANHEALVRLSSELVVSQTRVDTTEERWLALADQAESIGMDI